MLVIQKQPKYLKKRVQLPNGSWALVVFELEGNTWKAIYGELIETKSDKAPNRFATGKEILALPAHFEAQHIAPIISPFFAEVKTLVRDFAFVISQPTRAPGF